LENKLNEYEVLKSLEDIKKHILNKIFQSSNKINKENISLCFLLILNKIKIKLNYSLENIEFLNDFIPLKYFKINFEKEYFEIDFGFPFIKEILCSNILIEEADQFFINNKFTFVPYLESYCKSYYFEFAAKYRFKNILQNFNNIKEITVDNLIEMSYLIKNPIENALQQIFHNQNEIPKTNQVKNKNEQIFEIKYDFFDDIFNNVIKNINYYKNKKHNLNTTFEKTYDYSNYESLLINQNFIRGKYLDLAFIYGGKTFIGIQIKAYTNKTSNLSSNLNFLDKSKIKENIFKIIEHLKKLLNVDIKEWKYLLILYYNKNDKDGPYCSELVNKCKVKNIGYIFYDPYEKIFLYDNFNKIINIDFDNILFNLDIDQSLNSVDYWLGDINKKSKNIFLQKKRDKNISDYSEIKNAGNLLINILKTLNDNKNLKEIEIYNKFINQISEILNIKLNNKIKIFSYIKANEIQFPFPKENYIIVAQKQIINTILLFVDYENNILIYDMKEQQKIEDINEGINLIDRNKYLIILKIDD
jgi:hypothetical protein